MPTDLRGLLCLDGELGDAARRRPDRSLGRLHLVGREPPLLHVLQSRRALFPGQVVLRALRGHPLRQDRRQGQLHRLRAGLLPPQRKSLRRGDPHPGLRGLRARRPDHDLPRLLGHHPPRQQQVPKARPQLRRLHPGHQPLRPLRRRLHPVGRLGQVRDRKRRQLPGL